MKNIFLIGPIGAGKSTIGKYLAEELKLDFIDSDKEIEKKCGASIDWILDIEGEDGFKKRENSILKVLVNKKGVVLATSGSIILSPKNRTLLSSRGKIIYLQTSLEKQLLRTSKDKKRPFLEKDKKRKLKSFFIKRGPLYIEIADLIINTNNISIRNIVKIIVNSLKEIT